MSRAWPVDGIKAAAPLGANARRILAVRIAEVYSYRPIIHRAEAVEPTHALRISLKRLRYTLELFASVFGDAGATQIARVRALQETLGDLHDLDVRLDLTEGARDAASHEPEPDREISGGLARYADRERARRGELHRRFVQQWNGFQQAGMRRDLVQLSQVDPGR